LIILNEIGEEAFNFPKAILKNADLRNWFAKTLATDVAVFEIIGQNSFYGIGVLVAKKYLEKRVDVDKAPAKT